MATLRGNTCDIYWGGYGSSTFTTEVMTCTTQYTVWTITDATKRMWDPAATTLVYNAGAPVTNYASIQYCGGKVSWAASQGNVAMTVSGKYLSSPAQMSQAHSWTLNASTDKEDTTVFGDTVKKQTATTLNGTITVSRFYPGSGGFAIQALAPTTYPRVALVLYETVSTGVRWECYATIDSVEYAVEASNIIPESVTFTLDGTYGLWAYTS